MPDLNSIDKCQLDLKNAGFQEFEIEDISSKILPSTLRMRLNSEMRMSQSNEPVTPEIYISRKAVIASHKVIESGLIGYYLINAKKNS
jgi:hypothetical protein